MRRIFKLIIWTLGVMIMLGLIAGWILHKPLPEGESGPEAEALADRVLEAINYTAYDTLEIISWSYPRGHHYSWDKKHNRVQVMWDHYEVHLNPDSLTGTAYANGVLLQGEDEADAVWKAWKLFANDSFWLVAPFKIRDPGTKRAVVKTERGDALLVTYTSGGVTPGDSYLWILDENFRPVTWQLWVKIIPIGGLAFSWEHWEQHQGAWFALGHQGPGPVYIQLDKLQIN